MLCGSSSQYRQHNAMWLFVTVQTTQCNVALHRRTDNTMQCDSSLLYKQHSPMWLFITVQTTHCNVALHHRTDNTMQCIHPSMHNNTFSGAPVYVPMQCICLSMQIIQCIVPPSPNLLESWSLPVPLWRQLGVKQIQGTNKPSGTYPSQRSIFSIRAITMLTVLASSEISSCSSHGLFIAIQTTQCNVALHHCTDNTMQCGSSSLYRQHNAMWLFIAVQTTQCNVALHHCTDNTMQCGSSSLYRQHNAMWPFIAVQTTQCNVALHRCTDNTMQCGSSSLHRHHTAMWLFITVQTTQCIQPSMHNNTFFWYLFIFHRQIIDELTFLAQKEISGTQARHRIQHLPEVDNQICACCCCLLHTRADT